MVIAPRSISEIRKIASLHTEKGIFSHAKMSSIEAERKPFLAIEDSTEDQQAFIERYSLLQKGRAGRQCLLTLLQSALLVLNIFFLVSNISMHEICSVGTENKSGFERTFCKQKRGRGKPDLY